jgi:23S rRNA (pseudouridine1915-N3)-methyltransferase
LKVTVLYIGRPKDAASNQVAGEYARRLARFCDFRMRQIRDESALDRYNHAYLVVLDPAGRHWTSEQFAAFIDRSQNNAVRELLFLVGGADGVSDATRRKADLLLALSRLTLPHELARVVLAEQIYRAFTILRGHPYAR